MAEVKAVARFVRMSPRKVRRIVDLIRGKQSQEALVTLRYMPQAAAQMVSKVLRSALANAEHNHDLKSGNLKVVRAFVDAGPTLKRIQPHAQGRAFPIKKRSSHITIVVGEE